MSRSRYQFTDPHEPHFLTCTVVEWLPVFTREEARQILLETWNHQQEHHELRLYGYVVMENHLHAVAQAEQLPLLWARFKSYTAQELVKLLKKHRATPLLQRMERTGKAYRQDRNYQFWQEGSHPQLILGPDMLRQKLEYIHLNPVKRGYVDNPEAWRWSSARDYAGRPGLIKVKTDW